MLGGRSTASMTRCNRRHFRILNVVDDVSHQCLAANPDA